MPIVSIYLMGSYAWWDKPNDLDIVVVLAGDKEFTRISASKLALAAREVVPDLETNYEVVGLETLKKAARGSEFPQSKVVRRKLTTYSGAIPLSGADIFRRNLPPMENYRTLSEDLFTDLQFARWEETRLDAAKIEAKKNRRLEEIDAIKEWMAKQGKPREMSGVAAPLTIAFMGANSGLLSGTFSAATGSNSAMTESAGEGILSAIWAQVYTHPHLAVAALALTAFLIMWNTNFWKWPLFRYSYYKSVLNSQKIGSRPNYIRGMMWFAENKRFSPERLPVVFSHSDAAKILVAKKAMALLKSKGMSDHKARSLVLKRWQEIENAVAGKNGVGRLVSSWDNMRLDPKRVDIMKLFDVEYEDGKIKIKGSSSASFGDELPVGRGDVAGRGIGKNAGGRNIVGVIGISIAAMLLSGRA
ncbi:MAG TPA: hypothetical protein PLV52_07170, partial [Candidatus Omnitrophota bacterium]|nr:hypothetical protein [Candidatus Omnitrophota bacterium]